MVEFSQDNKVVILTGAGISAESGIKTFRASDGLWENHAIEDVATPYAWEKDPELVWKGCKLGQDLTPDLDKIALIPDDESPNSGKNELVHK